MGMMIRAVEAVLENRERGYVPRLTAKPVVVQEWPASGEPVRRGSKRVRRVGR